MTFGENKEHDIVTICDSQENPQYMILGASAGFKTFSMLRGSNSGAGGDLSAWIWSSISTISLTTLAVDR